MSHSRNDLVRSAASSLTSYSSDASVEFYEEKLKPGIEAIKNSGTSLQELVGEAEKIINEKFMPNSRRVFKHTNKNISVGLDNIMLAMLACAEECGGEVGKRYVASAILACSKEGDIVGALAALGTTWLTHLLFVFKAGQGHRNQPNEEPSEFATPTIDLLDGIGSRKESFSDDVMIRDGYTCVLTGFQDRSHPQPTEGIPRVTLTAAHILRRAAGKFDRDRNSRSYISALTTFDILANFTRLPVQTLEELHDRLDDPSNGMMLEFNAHDGFDRFEWCLKQTETKHEYDLKIFKTEGILRMPENNRVSFRDHSDDFLPTSTCKRNRSVDLPNPDYIAIHAAITGVLNMSGAGKFFDELLDKYRDDEGNVSPCFAGQS